MTLPPSPAQATEKRAGPPPATSALPQWEQLQPEHQRALVMTLAAMIVKELPVPHVGRTEASDE
jgi:hypothetical protein